MGKFILGVIVGAALGAFLMFRGYDRTIDYFNLETPVEVLHGKASYYGVEHGFHGHCMSNGEIFDKEGMTAAMKKLHLGAKVRVIRGFRSVVLRITDRGKLRPGRIIDLSEAAARKLGMIEEGVSPVTIEVLFDPEEDIKYHHENPECLKGSGEPEGVAMNAKIERSRRFLLLHWTILGTCRVLFAL